MRTCVHMENPLGYFNHPLRLHNFLQQELLNSHENHFERRKPIAIYVAAAKVFLIKYCGGLFSKKKESVSFGLVWFLMPKKDFESTNFANFEEVVHNFSRCEDDMIY